MDEDYPEPHLYEKEGNYTITLRASHRKNFNKEIVSTQNVIVTSWSIDSIRVNSVPDFYSWDFGGNNGPDMKIKINDSTLQFQNVFIADFVAYFPYNLDTSQLPYTAGNMDFKLYYSNWEFRLLDDDVPLPNQFMNSWIFNPYDKGSGGNFKLDGNGYNFDVFYKVNLQ